MNRSRRLIEAIAEVSDLLVCLDLSDLPALYSIRVRPHTGDRDLIDGAAMLAGSGTELDQIEAIHTWAGALGGVVLLGDEDYPGTDFASRTLAALIPLPSGGLFEVWTTLNDLRPAPGWRPTTALLPA